MKNYRGGIMWMPDESRKINLKEEVTINNTGQKGTVVELCEGNYVFNYYVRFPDEPDHVWHRFNTDEVTPVENP